MKKARNKRKKWIDPKFKEEVVKERKGMVACYKTGGGCGWLHLHHFS
ncbi:MAG: hypothetical protein KAS99_01035 [Candidatus Omnitrophica bacterium]|nr:hypothetical protein [Candidatus Omnitrophota bacterium]